jgi:SAM-dependent methyltransferase
MKNKPELPDDFLTHLKNLEESYLNSDDPVMQSGFGGGNERWRRERGIILNAVNEDGDFLDVGCANGYLLECLVLWSKEKGVKLTPFGVDISAKLIDVAKKCLPQYKSNFQTANAWEWIPPRKFRYVYSIYDNVPDELFIDYINHLLKNYVEHDGTLIIGAYGSISKN